MGVAFSHCDASWAYSGFNRFRQRLAKASIGVNLNSMEGFGGIFPWDNFDDDIIPLLNHSDCDGELTPEECAKVAPRLKELVEAWGDYEYDKRTATELISGMEKCAAANEPLEFL